MTKWLISGLVVLMMSPGIAGAQDDWEFALTPFLWGSGISGTVGFSSQEADFEVSAKDLMKQLDFAFMTNFEARKGRWSYSLDFDYTNLGKDVTVENADVAAQNPQLDLSMTIFEADMGYEAVDSLDFFFGIRAVSASAGLMTDQSTVPEVDGGFVDPILGLRFRRYLSEKFWVNVRGDVGGFGVGSDFSWFVAAAGGFRVSKLISLDFGYRIWDFDYQSENNLSRLDLALAGFGGGLTFHF